MLDKERSKQYLELIKNRIFCVLSFSPVKLDLLQQKAVNFYRKNCQSIEIVKDDELQKVNFRVKNKVKNNQN